MNVALQASPNVDAVFEELPELNRKLVAFKALPKMLLLDGIDEVVSVALPSQLPPNEYD